MTTMAPTPTRYRIAVRGRLSRRLSSAFEGMALEDGPHGSVLAGDLLDQGQLYGMLDRLRDFGIELLGVEQAHGLAEDWSLLASAREGDSRAFAALVARHHGTVARVASSVVPEATAARELAARTWANALDARGAAPEPGQLDRWLVTLLLTLAAQPAAGAIAAGERGIELGGCLGDQVAQDGVRAGSRALVDSGSGVPSSRSASASSAPLPAAVSHHGPQAVSSRSPSQSRSTAASPCCWLATARLADSSTAAPRPGANPGRTGTSPAR